MARLRNFLTFPNILSGTFLTIVGLFLMGCEVKTLDELAEDGDAEAQFELAQIYDTGDFYEDGNPDENHVDLAKAALWYRKAAEQGHPEAQYELALMYDNGDGVQEDLAQATEWYRRAAKQGHVDAKAIIEERKTEADGKVAEVNHAGTPIEKKPERNLKEIVARIMPSVGTVMIRKGKGYVPNGSGFFISEDGQFVTNWHVVDDGQSFRVKREDGATFEVKEILYANPKRDLAILNVRGTGFTPLTLSGSNEASVADSVAVIGSPQGLGGSVTEGIVSAIRDYGDIFPDQTMTKNTKCVQVSAAISHGSSGSAIVSLETGKVIAVATFFHKGGQSLNFGVAAEHISELLVAKTNPKTIIADKTLPTGNKLKPGNGIENAAGKEWLSALESGQTAVYNGDYDKALKFLIPAQKLAEQRVGKFHTDYGITLDYLATCYIRMGQLDLAQKMAIEALVIQKNTRPETSRHASALNCMAELYQANKLYNEAIQHYKESLVINADIYGLESKAVDGINDSLMHLYVQVDNFEKARPLANRLLKKSIDEYGLNSLNAVHYQFILGDLEYYTGNYDAAVSCYEQIRKPMRKKYGDYGKEMLVLYKALWNAHTKAGNASEARIINTYYYQKALKNNP